MSQVQVTVTVPNNVTDTEVNESRAGFVDSLGKVYGAGRKYAAVLVAFFRNKGHGDGWMAIPHDHKGPEGDAMRAERDTLYKALREAGHSNPSVKWSQIKGYAIDLVTAEKAESGEAEDSAEGEGEGEGNTKHTRSMQLRLIQDLCTLHKACKREARTLTEQQRQASVHIASALSALGVDLNGL